MTSPDVVLDIDGLVVRYADGPEVLQGISFTLGPQEIVGLIGASGAGKSTVLRAVQRLVEPTAGSVRLGGTELTTLGPVELRDARRRMGMIFQEHALVDRLTVMENVLCGALGRTGFWRTRSSSSTAWVCPGSRIGGVTSCPVVRGSGSGSRVL